ncbi:MAG: hypothetical protein K2X87_30460 [Gemmataceae bacterium]|nr:hypothetical protein [Gemmataceae bacterium]
MSIVIHVDDLVSRNTTPYRKLWGMLLLMAIRDRAASVHYHPWRADGPLAYIVDNVRHVLKPPIGEAAGPVISAARSLLAPRRGLLNRLLGRRPAMVSGSFLLRLETEEGVSDVEWTGACWEAGRRAGVEFYQVAPIPGGSRRKPRPRRNRTLVPRSVRAVDPTTTLP